MASCQTTRWVSSAPYVKLTVTENTSSSDGDTAVLSWTLEYIASSAAVTSVSKAYTVTINGSTVKDSTFAIGGKTGTHTVASGTTNIDKSKSEKTISFGVTFHFGLTWSGVYRGTLEADGSISVPAITTYTIQYNANGGSGAPSSQTKYFGTALTLSSTKPSRTGYTFSTWNTNSSGTGTNYSSGASYTANAAATLYAKWTAKTYTVSYNANGGSGAPANQTKTHGTTLTLSTTQPTKTNYNFKGWALSASATTAAYASGASYTANSGVTLYAVWELAYTKPRITNLTATRGELVTQYEGIQFVMSDEGVRALVEFDWVCDNSVSSIAISWVSTGGSTGSRAVDWASGTSGKVTELIDTTTFDAETTYTFTVTVTDSDGSSSATVTMSGSAFTIDTKAGGDGVSFGKPAELGAFQSLGGKGVADFAFDAKFNQPVYGTVRGLDKLPAITTTVNLDNYLTPGCWAVRSNDQTKHVHNIPVQKAGCLEVIASTGEGVRSGGWSYLRQRYIPFRGEDPIYERDISRDDTNAWTYGDWHRVTLTPAAESKVYHTQSNLWSGTATMNASQTITLTEGNYISDQPNGIVLVFSRWVPQSGTTPGYAEDASFHTFFVPKQQVINKPGVGYTFVMATTLAFETMAAKYLYINDATITGHDSNTTTGTGSSGIKYANNRFVLRYVIGV